MKYAILNGSERSREAFSAEANSGYSSFQFGYLATWAGPLRFAERLKYMEEPVVAASQLIASSSRRG